MIYREYKHIIVDYLNAVRSFDIREIKQTGETVNKYEWDNDNPGIEQFPNLTNLLNKGYEIVQTVNIGNHKILYHLGLNEIAAKLYGNEES